MLRSAIVLLLLITCVYTQASDFDPYEKSVPQLQAAMERGDTTSHELVQAYLARIAAFDQQGPRLNAMLYINPRVLEEARALDRERRDKGARGPLHGVPMVLKDNYDTFDMPTTAGSVALAGFTPPNDGYQVRKLREAGAVFIGKTNLHEFARGIETVGSMAGQTRNPYDPARNPGGSSGGTAAAVAANFAAIGMGSDTCGSIRIPAANNNLYGLRVTQGLSSRDGIVPLSHTQDVGGPIARSVVDLVAVLDATVGMDPLDDQTQAAANHVPKTYREFLDKDALKGARLGLLKNYLRTFTPYGEITTVVRDSVAKMAASGAEIIELEIEGLDDLLRTSSVIDIEFPFDLARYLEVSNAPVKSLEEILHGGNYHVALEARYRRSLNVAEGSEDHRARLARRADIAWILQEALSENELDALIYPTLRIKPLPVGEAQYGSLCRIAAHSGLPAITIPAGFTPDGVPVGVELLSGSFSEGRLLGLAYAWEQAAQPRRPPPRTPSLVSGELSVPFELESNQASGKLRLERPTQTLHYALRIKGVKDRDIVDIKLHRGEAGSNGPVIALLGSARKGSVAVDNSNLEDLVNDNLYVVVYTRDKPGGSLRGQIQKAGE